MLQELPAAAGNINIHSPNPFRADRSNNMADNTPNLGDNIIIMKGSQRKVKKKLSINYGAIQTHSCIHPRYLKI